MNKISTFRSTVLDWSGRHRQRAQVALAAASLALLAGCTTGVAEPAASGGASSAASPAVSAGTGGSGSGTVISSGNRNGGQGNQGTGSFTLAFARCMRAHGVPNFPDPNGQAGQLGPGSGIDPTSPEFQSAINGPCKSMAPPGWVDSGKVTR